jgi:hypothetical protein
VAKLEKTIDDLEGRTLTRHIVAVHSTVIRCYKLYSPACALWLCLALHPPLGVNLSSSLSPLPLCASTDELYAQKLKYKAISEELDHALNDMTSM